MFRYIATGSAGNLDADYFEGIVYAYVLGSLLGGTLGGAEVFTGEISRVNTTQYGQALINDGVADKLIQFAVAMPTDSAAYKLVQSMGAEPTAYQIGQLGQAIAEDIQAGAGDVADMFAKSDSQAVNTEDIASGGSAQTNVPADFSPETQTFQSGAQMAENGIPKYPKSAEVVSGKTYTTAESEKFSGIIGRDVLLYDGSSDSDAEYAFTDGVTIFVNANRGSVQTAVVTHELTHTLENTAEYGEYKSYVLDSTAYQSYLRSRGGLTHEELITRKVAALQKAGKTGDLRAQAEQEIVADFTGNYLVHSEEHLAELARDNPRGFQALWNAIREVWHKLMIRLGINTQTNEYRRMELMFQRAYASAQNASRTQQNPASRTFAVFGRSQNVFEGRPFVVHQDLKLHPH